MPSPASRSQGLTPEAPTQPWTSTAPRSLLDTNETAGKGTSMETQPELSTPIPANAIRHGECGSWWSGTERSHCGGCHKTFSSLTSFDRHRRGLRCNPPESVGLVAREKPFGDLWGLPAPVGGYGAVHADRDGVEAAA